MMRTGPRQGGAILIGLAVALVLATGLAFLQHANRSNATTQAREALTMAALQSAREALLARAVLDQNRPGSLPCPDTNDDGIADLAYPNCLAYVGRLPWRTLNLADPRDGSGERLWYVLSPNFNDGNTAINSTTSTPLTLDGQAGIVALIIAPGGAHADQTRPANSSANYLDDAGPSVSNRDGDDHYVSGPAGASFNDRILALDTNTLFAAVSMRLLGDLRQAVTAAGGSLPHADIDGDGRADPPAVSGRFPYLEPTYDLPSPTWPSERWYAAQVANAWFPLIAYDRDTATVSIGSRSRPLP